MAKKLFLNTVIRIIKPKDYLDVKLLLTEGTKYHMNLDNDFKKMVEENIEYFNNELEKTITKSDCTEILVCEIQKDSKYKIIGILVYCFENENTIYISDLYIQSLYRKNGIATKLLNELIAKYPKKKIKLMCLVKNKLAYDFYTKYGFEVIETSKGKKYKINNYTMLFFNNKTNFK